MADDYPAEGVSLRAGSDDTIVIQDVGDGRPVVIGEVDRAAAPVLVHEGAVYIHEGRTFLVTRLDWEGGAGRGAAGGGRLLHRRQRGGRPGDPGGLRRRRTRRGAAGARADPGHGAGDLVFRKIKRYTHETLGYGTIDLPPREFETTAFWLWLDPGLVERLEDEGRAAAAQRLRAGLAVGAAGGAWPATATAAASATRPNGRARRTRSITCGRSASSATSRARTGNDRLANALDNLITLCPACHQRAEAARGTRSALGGLAYALGNIAPLYLMCDPRDLGVEAETRASTTRAPTITFYDRVAEGLGLAERLYELHDELLRAALELVESCGCLEGCPACVGPSGVGGRRGQAAHRAAAQSRDRGRSARRIGAQHAVRTPFAELA